MTRNSTTRQNPTIYMQKYLWRLRYTRSRSFSMFIGKTALNPSISPKSDNGTSCMSPVGFTEKSMVGFFVKPNVVESF